MIATTLDQTTLIADLKIVPPALRQPLKVLRHNWHRGSLDIVFPNGKVFEIRGHEPGPAGVLKVSDFRFLKRVLAAGDIGFCDGYVAGEWDTPDLAALLEVFTLNIDRLKRFLTGNPLVQMINRVAHFFNRNTKEGSKRNIFAHYDLGNAFYGQWLDQTMTYSSALFRDTNNLEAAQTAKYAALARMVDLKAGQHVLEIGCGWGGFAEYAAKVVGARATCLTISQAQHDYAVERMKRLGLDNRVEVLMLDYRDVQGQFDAIVSIEMFEAVGEQFWGDYFRKVQACLKPGGKAALQIITIRDDLFEEYRQRPDFIQKYIFPGGMLPSLEKLRQQTDKVGLTVMSDMAFGHDYAHTLKLWAQRFDAAWNEGRITGFDAAFRKMWLFYLAYCEAGFRTGRTDVVHFGIQKA
ncbi:cyclopropane-fatty-acyl-phospholipid synthase [Asticcacaulis sp. BYS171W]|uniref:Cyclopropane-fatty-acyl-phospholipid synthase n=1 Tax=Asticcacaulis aquaticus TaxID=2984212 RepID=A0ABT5HV46_9CAUL|nr:cyclopropane-fatty-acyl-phospholipid synthase family protein [Asticcacaulis aquaticus]MDC7683951.1 cyclopropane-fatty-acyl-phospholipid synthase [Asticcacaulis aquaticus]